MKNSTKMTFTEFLVEFDYGDHQLQQQHLKQQRQRSTVRQGEDAFKDKMANNPNRGDIVIVKANRYIVTGGSQEGVMVKSLDGRGSTVIPHGTKFKNVGVSPKNGKTIFKAIM